MLGRKTVFITIDFADVPGLFDYPKHLPIPRIGERVLLNAHAGTVENVTHNTAGDVTEIKITCSTLK